MMLVFWKIFYNLVIIPISFPMTFLFSIFFKKVRKGLLQRFQAPERLEFKMLNRGRAKTIWFHLASSGEFLMTRPIVDKIKEELGPTACTFVYTFTSPSGVEWLQKNNPEEIFDFYPFDDPHHVDKTIQAIHPSMLILIRYDIWPNLIWLCHKYSIPTFLISATAKKNSFKFQSFILKSFYKSIFSEISLIFPLNEYSKQKFNKLLKSSKSIQESGDIKIDSTLFRQKQAQEKILPQIQNILLTLEKNFSQIILGASTWQKEKKMLIESFSMFNSEEEINDHPKINRLLILAPHEPSKENIDQIITLCEKHSLQYILLSQFDGRKTFQVFIVDQVGALMNCFSIAHFAMIGLGKGGLHNFVEAIAWKVPCTFYKGKWKDYLAQEFVENQLITPVADSKQLYKQMNYILSSSKEAKSLTKRSYDFLLDKANTSEKVIPHLLQQLGIKHP